MIFFIKIHNRINSYASSASIMHMFFKNHLKKLQTNIITRIKISITINQIDKHKAKYITTVCIPIIIIKMSLLFFFIVYKNEWKENKF